MPNWCDTSITITCDSDIAIERFYNLLCCWCKNKQYDINLGDILVASGEDINTYSHRGELSCYSYDRNILSIATTTAWTPMLAMWQNYLDKYLPGGDLFYEAVEPGCGIFLTNDPDMIGKYYVDDGDGVLLGFEDIVFGMSESELREKLQQLLHTNEDDINRLLSLIENSDYEELSIHQYEYCNISYLN